MPRIIILNDITTWNRIGMSRYAGPYVVASRLREHGYDVRIVEWFTQHEDPLQLVEALLTPDTLGVCLSRTFLTPDPYEEEPISNQSYGQLNRQGRELFTNASKSRTMWFTSGEQAGEWFRRLRDLLDRKAPEARIILGGARVGSMMKPEAIQRSFPTVDYALVGYADASAVHLFDDLSRNRIPYGTDRGGVRFVRALTAPKICPAIRYEQSDLIQPGEALPIELKRGCAFNCKFCHYEKRGATMKDPGLLRDELQYNYDHFGTTLYTFSDDCFNDTRPNVELVCNTLAKLPFRIEWISFARADLSIKFPDTLAAMVDSGARGLFFGIETFNYAAGRAAGKGVPPDRVKQWLIDVDQKYRDRMLVQCSFISGLPHETDQSMQDTIDWLEQHRPFPLFSMGPLIMSEYTPDMDESAVDFPDYAINPQKYGFEEVRHHPEVYWRHASMDLVRAREWTDRANQSWYAPHRPKPMIRSLWWYPAYRSLGITHEEILDGVRDSNGWSRNNAVREKFKKFSERYWNALVESSR